MNALKAIVSRSRATLSLMLLVLLAGIMSRASMPIEVNPNVTVPAAIIMVRHEGISPEAVSYTHLTLPTNREV